MHYRCLHDVYAAKSRRAREIARIMALFARDERQRDTIVLFVALVSVTVLGSAFAVAVARTRTMTRDSFEVRDSDGAVSWLRTGILALNRVPNLMLPGVARTDREVPVRESTVWRDALAPDRDGLFVAAPRASSLAELTLNERHPYTPYLRDFDDIVTRLRTQGRGASADALSDVSIRDLETRAFAGVRESGTGRVYTLDPGFETDRNAARAAYAMIFAAAGARACVVNGAPIDSVLAEAADLAGMRSRNANALDRVRARTDSDVTRARSELLRQFRDTASEMASRRAAAAERNRDLDEARTEATESVAHARAEHARVARKADTAHRALDSSKRTAAALDARVDQVAIARGGVTANLAAARRRASAIGAARRNDESAVERNVNDARDDTARAVAASTRSAPDARSAERTRARAYDRLQSVRRANASVRTRAETAAAAADDARRESGDLRSQILSERQRGDALATKRSELAAHAQRAGRAQTEAARRAGVRLARAMDANNESDRSYALWSKYASLTRLEDELDAHDDGLPGQRANAGS